MVSSSVLFLSEHLNSTAKLILSIFDVTTLSFTFNTLCKQRILGGLEMSTSSNYIEEALVGRESLFRRKLSQLRTTGEIKRMSNSHVQSGFKELEQNVYLNNVSANLLNCDPRQLEKVALLDSLTELYNHDTIKRMLKDEVKRALRYKRDLSTLAITLDCSTKISRYGDDCDVLLKKTAQNIMHVVRDVDIPGRYDRERILIICPETSISGAVCLAQRLCHQISAQQNLDVNQNWDVTISVGVSSFPMPAQNDQQLLDLAFSALSLARQSGGNAVKVPN